jgi:hypothetical protein
MITIKIKQKFAAWTVLELPKKHMVLCQCDCGTVKPVNIYNLVHGRSTGCGCTAGYQSTHGLSKTPEYFIWATLKQQCNNKNSRSYPGYGGKGVKLCKRWEKFENFLADMGERPNKSFCLRQINPLGDFSPENCEWQKKPKGSAPIRGHKFLTFNGKTQSLSAWARELKITRNALGQRLSKGWTLEETVTAKKRTLRHAY